MICVALQNWLRLVFICNMRKYMRQIRIPCMRAKKLEKEAIESGKKIESVEANPHTDIYKVIKKL